MVSPVTMIFLNKPSHAHDNRWLYRPRVLWTQRNQTQLTILEGNKHFIASRRPVSHLVWTNPTLIFDTGNPAMFSCLTLILDKRGLDWHGLGGAVLGRDFQRCAGGEGIPKSHKM